MDRQLLSKILAQMRDYLKEGKPFGDLKVSALLALGSQLEAIFYYLGHELGTILKVDQVKEVSKIPEALKKVIAEYNIGEMSILETSKEIVQLQLKGHSSIRDLVGIGIDSPSNFSSFEAGLLAGIVEKMSNIHCFAQELSSNLEEGQCEFMIVYQRE